MYNRTRTRAPAQKGSYPPSSWMRLVLIRVSVGKSDAKSDAKSKARLHMVASVTWVVTFEGMGT